MKKPKIHYSQAPLLPIKQTEGEIQAQVIQYLLDNQWLTVRINSMAAKIKGRFLRSYYVYGLGASKGFPDVLAVKQNHCILLEIKTVKGEKSPEQVEFAEYSEKCGATVLTIRNINDLQTYLKDNLL